MTAISAVAASRSAGADVSDSAPCWTTASTGAGDTFPPGPSNYLFVRSTNTGAVTVTVIAAGGTAGPSGTFLAPLALAPNVDANTGKRMYGPFPASSFADASDGLVHVTYSSTTNVKVAVLNFSAT